MSEGWWRAIRGGVTVRVKAQPRARRPGLGGTAPGLDGPRLRLAVTEAAEDGRANRAICATLAEALGVAGSTVTVLQGAGSREKLLQVTGDPDLLAPKLKDLA
ncbi:MAG: DUF167 domain-containing protein [Acetobacteraceae bacterium]|nr:MAG: DUF167 domain-containing protein [Acetobacteraceae bacterium]